MFDSVLPPESEPISVVSSRWLWASASQFASNPRGSSASGCNLEFIGFIRFQLLFFFIPLNFLARELGYL